MYLLILCWMYFFQIAIIFILYLSSSYQLQMGKGNSGTMFVLQDQSLCGWRYLIFHVLYPIYTIFCFTRWHFIITFARLYICIDPSAEWEGCIWGRERGSFVPFTYLGLALDRGWYKDLIWHKCRVKWVPLNGCCYAPVCLSMCL